MVLNFINNLGSKLCTLYHTYFLIQLQSAAKIFKGFLIFSATTFLLTILTFFIYAQTGPYRSPHSHYMCNTKIEAEACNIAAALSGYFALPSRTKVPSYSDLIRLRYFEEGFSFKDRQSERTKKLMKESEFSVKILCDDPCHEIKIVIYSKVNKCPFAKGRCPRRYKGRFYVTYVSSVGGNEGGWTNSY